MYTRRSALTAAAAATTVLTSSAAAHGNKPLPNAWDRLALRLGKVRGRLSLLRREEDPEVAELRRAVVALVAIVEDLVALENPHNG